MSHSIDRVEFRGAEFPVIDMGADLHAREAQLLHTAPHFLHGQVRGLHGQSAKTHKPPGVAAHRLGQVVVQEDTEIQGVLGFGL